MRRLIARAVLAGLLVSLPTAAVAQCILLGASSGSGGSTTSGQLVELSRTTGGVLRVRGGLPVGIGGMAQHPFTGVLYGVTAPGFVAPSGTPRNLVIIDPFVGVETVVGSIGLGNFGISDITFRSDGTLFGWSENSDDLITINTATGAGTIVANAAVSTFGSGLAFSATDTLYLAGNGSSGALRTVNTSTGVTTIVATLTGASGPSGPIPAMKFEPGTGILYAVHKTGFAPINTSDLVTINPTTGVITDLGPTLGRLDAIAFVCGAASGVPTLQQWQLIMLSAIAIAFAAWRLRRRQHVIV